jgi:Kinetochore protein Mis14 like
MGSSSLLINGMKPSLSSSIDQQGTYFAGHRLIGDMESFDGGLLARVQTLHREIEARTLEVTSLRRSIPAQVATLLQESCSLPETAPVPEPGLSSEGAKATIELTREDEVQETFTKGMKFLKDLKKGVPATSAKLEQAKEVVPHVYS